jgi:hypothetical protein
MLRLAADENLTNGIIRGLVWRGARADIVRVQDAGLLGADDSSVLAWAAAEGRILVTHDSRTVPRYASQRLDAGLPMPGVFVVPRSVSIGQAIDDLLLLCECSSAAEWEGLVFYLPL